MRLKIYPETKPSGIDWLGDIPKHWRIVRLKYLSSIKYGLGQPPNQQDEGIPLLRATNVERGKINPLGLMFIDPNDVPYSRDPILKTGDILVVRSGAYTGDSAIVPPEYDGAIAGYDMVVRAKGCNPHYLAYSLLSDPILTNQINLQRLRAAQPHLNAEELGDCLFFMPPAPEQQAIAAYLNRKTAQVDAVLREKEEQIRLLTEQRQAVISHAVTRGLDQDVLVKPSGIDWLGDIPMHWEAQRLKFLCEKIGSGKTPRGGATTYMDSGIVFLRSQNIYNDGLRLDDAVYISAETDEEMAQTRVFPNDILLNITGASIGRTCIVPDDFPAANINQHVCILRLWKGILPHFVSYCLKSHLLRMQIDSLENGSSREGLNFEQIGNLMVTSPNGQGEQEAIVQYLDTETARLDGIIQTLTQQIGELRDYRQALISAVVTGKVDVREVEQ